MRPKLVVGVVGSVVLAVAAGVVAVRLLASDHCDPVSPVFEPTLVNGPDASEEALAEFLASPRADGAAAGLGPEDFEPVERTTTHARYQSSNGEVDIVLDYVQPNMDESGWYVSDASVNC